MRSDCTEINVVIVPDHTSEHIVGNQEIAPGFARNYGAKTMHPGYFDLFLAFIGLSFGVPSALPRLFFRNEDSSGPRAP